MVPTFDNEKIDDMRLMNVIKTLEGSDSDIDLNHCCDPLENTLKSAREENVRKRVWVCRGAVGCVILLIGAVIAVSVLLTREDSDGELVVVKSTYDARQFKVGTMANGIRYVLVSDEKASVAAAAVDVGVGHFSDPKEWPGLAHFGEHMLFMGSKRYPGEAKFSDTLQKYSGYYNAYTARETTNYYYELQAAGLAESLDVFGGFFESPLFMESTVDREVKAVDNEHSKNLNSDEWRIMQLTQYTSSPVTPLNSFGTGSVETLNKTGIRDALVNFFEAYYTTNRLTVAILSNHPMATLEELLEKSFGGIKKTETPPQPWKANPTGYPQPYPTGDEPMRDRVTGRYTGKILHVVPSNSGLRQLLIRWPVQMSVVGKFPEDGVSVLKELLMDKSEGRLLHTLLDSGLATALNAGLDDTHSWFTIIFCSVTLTSAGEARVDDVISLIYSYVKLMKDNDGLFQQWFAERRDLAHLTWSFTVSSPDASSFASDIASVIQKTPLESVLLPPSLSRYDAATSGRFFDAMTPQNSMTHIVTAAAASKATLKEPVYKTQYSYDDISNASYSKWAIPIPEASRLSFAGSSNVYGVTVDEAQAGHTAPADNVLSATPNKYAHSTIDAYYKGTVTKVPLAAFIFRMYRSTDLQLVNGTVSPLEKLAFVFAGSCITLALEDVAYKAKLASLSYDLQYAEDYIDITISGVSPKQHELFKAVLSALKNPLGPLPDERLQLVKATYQETETELAYMHAYYISLQELIATDVPKEVLLRELPGITVDHVTAALQEYKNTGCQMLVQGNFKDPEAHIKQLASVLDADICVQAPVLKSEERYMHRLQKGWAVIQIPNPDSTSVNDAVMANYQLGVHGVESEGRALLLEQLVGEDFSDQIRTKEALGYVAFAFCRKRKNVWLLLCTVQSNDHTGAYLDGRVEDFLAGYAKTLAAMSEQSFNEIRDTVAKQMQVTPQSIDKEMAAVWPHVANGGHVWDYKKKVSDFVTSITKSAMLSWYEEKIVSANRAKLSVEVYRKYF